MSLSSIIKQKALRFYLRRSRKPISYWRTLITNFYFLPFGQARKLPIIVYGKMRISRAEGRITIDCPQSEISRGMIRLNTSFDNGSGCPGGDMAISLGAGEIIFKGKANLTYNNKILLWGGGKLLIGNNVLIICSSIACCRHIKIGDSCNIGPEAIITDSNYHYTVNNLNHTIVGDFSSAISLGHHCWVGSRTMIMKGVNLPNYTTVASNSLVNKSISTKPYTLIGGSPAKILHDGYMRIFNLKKELEIATFFVENPDACEYPLQLPLEQYD